LLLSATSIASSGTHRCCRRHRHFLPPVAASGAAAVAAVDGVVSARRCYHGRRPLLLSTAADAVVGRSLPSMVPSAPTGATMGGSRCYRRQRPLLPLAPTDATVGSGRYYRRRRPLLLSATANAPVGAPRCYHQQRLLLPSMPVGSCTSRGLLLQRAPCWWLRPTARPCFESSGQWCGVVLRGAFLVPCGWLDRSWVIFFYYAEEARGQVTPNGTSVNQRRRRIGNFDPRGTLSTTLESIWTSFPRLHVIRANHF
jgi:hypothetical protein